jgi:hypothetical protein
VLLVVGGIALALGLLGPANATVVFAAIVALFGAAVLVGIGSLRRVRATRRPPSGG